MPYNPYGAYSPYPQPGYGFQPPQQQNTYAFVNGIEGAKSYPMQPNQTVMLMDAEQAVCYMKQSNNLGQSTLRYYKLVETSEAELRGPEKPIGDFVLKSDFDALAKKVESLLPKGE